MGRTEQQKREELRKKNSDKHEDCYNALMDNKERIVGECRIQKFVDKMSTNKTKKRSPNKFDDKRFYVNNIKSYPHDKRL